MSHAWKHSVLVVWDSEQPDLVVDVPAHCRGIGLDDL